MNTLPKITPVCQIEKKKKAKKYLFLSWEEFCEILRKIECGELRLPSGGSLADDIESALKEFIEKRYGFKVKLVTDKQKADAKYVARQVLLDKVRAIKLRQFIENEKRFPSALELDKYQDYSYEASLSPLCEQKAVFYNVLTKKRLPYTCGRLRCGCIKCADSAMAKRQARVYFHTEENEALRRMITCTLDQAKLPGDTLDEKREYAWNCIIGDSLAKFKRRLRAYLKKRGVDSADLHMITWIEPHKENQFPHAHIYMDEYVDYKIINKLGHKSGFGFMEISLFKDKKEMGVYASKKMRDYASKTIVDSPKSADNADEADNDDEKYFDRCALLYILPRKRLITYTRNLKKPEDTGLSAWSIVEGKSDNLLASELAENVDSKEYPIYPSAYTNTLIGLWNYIAGGSVKVKPSVAKLVEKARVSGDKTIIINLATELARCGYLVSIDKMEIIKDSPAIREIRHFLGKVNFAEKTKFHRSMAYDKHLLYRKNTIDD